jgi:hypothetical protein
MTSTTSKRRRLIGIAVFSISLCVVLVPSALAASGPAKEPEWQKALRIRSEGMSELCGPNGTMALVGREAEKRVCGTVTPAWLTALRVRSEGMQRLCSPSGGPVALTSDARTRLCGVGSTSNSAPKTRQSATGFEPAPTSVSAGRGFDWGDAAIGAGSSLGIVLILGGAVLLVLRRRDEGHERSAGTSALAR